MLILGLSAGVFAAKVVEVPPAEMYPEKQMAFDWLDQPQIIELYGKMSDVLWSYAELGMQEFKSYKLLTGYLEQNGFKVEHGMAGMPTCFVASYGSGKPVIGLIFQADALPMISQGGRVPYRDPIVKGAPGHGCGHNAQGPLCIASAMALKGAIDRYGLKGTIKIFGSPAEETLISRPYMVRAGLFDGVDVVLKNHTGSSFGGGQLGGVSGNAMFSTLFSFEGVTAHSAGGPWNAKSALDGVELMNDGVNLLREHLFYSYRIHYVIPSGGQAPNVVPDYASVWYFVRNSDDLVESDHEKVINCAKGAALATGTELTVRVYTAIHQTRHNAAFNQLAHQNAMLAGMPEWSDEEEAFAKELQKNAGISVVGLPSKLSKLKEWDPEAKFVGGGSGDTADVSMVTPLASLRVPVNASTGHHWSNVASSYGSIVWKGINACAKATVGTALDLMTKPELLQEVRDQFAEQVKRDPYRSYLPVDAVPPLELNEELMARYRTKMEPSYLEW